MTRDKLSKLLYFPFIPCYDIRIGSTTADGGDMESLISKEELLDYLQNDQLTGLNNADTFYRATHEMLIADPDTEYVMARFDVDSFSMVNELYGFEAGDHLLICIADVLRGFVRGRGTCGRIHADIFEICVTAYGFDPRELLNRMYGALRGLGMLNRITGHMGVYCITDHRMNAALMSDRANSVLRSIKGSHAEDYAYYSDKEGERQMREQMIIKCMYDALKRKEFRVRYQPIYKTETGLPECAEALVRWHIHGDAALRPAEFISIFEKCGFIVKLDYYIWEEVCREMRMRMDMGSQVMPVSVNMSRCDVFEPTIITDITALTECYGIPHDMLRFEITETIFGEDPRRLRSVIAEMQDLGFVILLDDFGSGYSTPSSLIEIPFDIVKIDREFIRNITSSIRCEYVLDSIFLLADSLEVPVVAEGVESAEQMDRLRKKNCEYVQGYYYSQPLNPEDYYGMIEKNRHR